MRTISQKIVDDAKLLLKSFVPYEEAKVFREMIHEWALIHYVPKNKPEDYLWFMNKWECKIDKVHPQCNNYNNYFRLFTTVSQHVYGDTIQECLDNAIEYEKGKPWFWYATPQPDGQIKVTYKIHKDTETVSAKVAIDVTDISHHPGIDGQHFKIPFDRPFKKDDMITVAAWNGIPLYIVEEPEHVSTEENGKKIYYWLHKVVMCDNKTGYFHPPKYLAKDMIYTKLIA